MTDGVTKISFQKQILRNKIFAVFEGANKRMHKGMMDVCERCAACELYKQSTYYNLH